MNMRQIVPMLRTAVCTFLVGAGVASAQPADTQGNNVSTVRMTFSDPSTAFVVSGSKDLKFEGGVLTLGNDVFVGDGRDGPLVVSSTAAVINQFGRLTDSAAAGAAELRLDDGSVFNPGDLMLLYVAQARFAEPGDQNRPRSVGTAGYFELHRVSTVNGTLIRLETSLEGAFDAKYTILVHVPEYSQVTIPSGTGLSTPSWDGKKGGIVAFASSGAVRIDGIVNATGRGFRGGPRNTGRTDACSQDALNGDNTFGRKGEGIDPRSQLEPTYLSGRGNLANGGGGGNPHNAGGGGGGNHGAGGRGGKEWIVCGGAASPQGLPGISLAGAPPSRFFIGGGGGGGQENNESGTGGGQGGGLIFVFAQAVLGTGRIEADGTSAASTQPIGGVGGNDGAGGGGAGGTVSVRTRTPVASTLGISTKGGDGGSIDHPEAHGPGGGGGGGRIVIGGPSSALGFDINGGRSGTVLASADAWGAENGAAGGLENGGYAQNVAAAEVSCVTSIEEVLGAGHNGAFGYLLSRDGGLTWASFRNERWEQTTLADQAMTLAQMNAGLFDFGAIEGLSVRIFPSGDRPELAALVFNLCQCGDGFADPGEICDDGNRDDGDGCASDCTVEDGGCQDARSASPGLFVFALLLGVALSSHFRRPRSSRRTQTDRDNGGSRSE
jgi:cysteine-rich repeat protein